MHTEKPQVGGASSSRHAEGRRTEIQNTFMYIMSEHQRYGVQTAQTACTYDSDKLQRCSKGMRCYGQQLPQQ